MRAIIQRVSNAQVRINAIEERSISRGLVLLVGIDPADTEEDIDYIVKKTVQMRLFSDEEDKMNHSLLTIEGELLCVSQFTLFAQTKKGNRPSFIGAAKPEIAIPLYNKLIEKFEIALPNKIKTGTFGADMQINLTNDGPVTIILDSKQKQ
ncbi:D-tyrosyl-tRNA(Tyr) deacylase [Putridiphycobacter roseus]|uniref:D-aminoacyl-tRNA deacylase n=1 Tax=Putridiphycobacter roseus TaxID=2219161 RepID=A0A2W1N964_9FLAO|nr:D-aminoacyl-tRNA deacylase [Putridiphycobacter roseus]PZE15795.1 D-tyrosyl-tRNA(Tyr) deacylase [Putridiphycobacter roseus]